MFVLCNIMVLGPALFTNTLQVGSRHFNAFALNYFMNHLLCLSFLFFKKTLLSIVGHLDWSAAKPNAAAPPGPQASIIHRLVSLLNKCLEIDKLKMHAQRDGIHVRMPLFIFVDVSQLSLSAVHLKGCGNIGALQSVCEADGGGGVRELDRHIEREREGREGAGEENRCASTIKAGKERKSRCCTIGSSVLLLLLLLQRLHLQYF